MPLSSMFENSDLGENHPHESSLGFPCHCLLLALNKYFRTMLSFCPPLLKGSKFEAPVLVSISEILWIIELSNDIRW